MNKLEMIIEERGLRKGWIAKKVKIAPGTLSKIVKGESIPTLPVALRIAELLEMTVEELWGEFKNK